jgi:F420-dependent oxidoreductase-like protein
MLDPIRQGAAPGLTADRAGVNEVGSDWGRIGLVLRADDASRAVKAIERAEARAVPQVWMPQPAAIGPDVLGVFAVAASRTRAIRLGTAIVPTLPRHPIVLAQQVLTIVDIGGANRLRLGIGPSHRAVMEQMYGLDVREPNRHLEEYVSVLRGILHAGECQFSGQHYTVHASNPHRVAVPILISALRSKAFRLAGRVADGALTWYCPPAYLQRVAVPDMAEASAAAGRAKPPLIAHILVAMSSEEADVRRISRSIIGQAGRRPNYRSMLIDAGIVVADDGAVGDEFLDQMVVWGSESEIRSQLKAFLSSGIDELMVEALPMHDPDQETDDLMALIGHIATGVPPGHRET